MTELDAREIGTLFLRKINHDVDDFGNKLCLGYGEDYTIFYSFLIVGENGERYLGTQVLLIDKRTSFCLIVSGSPNFFRYHIRLFRIMKLHELYDEQIDYMIYRQKEAKLDVEDFVQAIFLLLKSHPNHLNAFLVFLDVLILLEAVPVKDKILSKLSYKAVTFNEETLSMFCKGCKIFEESPLVKSKVQDLENKLFKKELSIKELDRKNDENNQKYQKEIEDLKALIKKED